MTAPTPIPRADLEALHGYASAAEADGRPFAYVPLLLLKDAITELELRRSAAAPKERAAKKSRQLHAQADKRERSRLNTATEK